MLFPGRIYIARGPWYFGDNRNIFLPNGGEDQKKSYHLSAGLLALCHMEIRPWSSRYVIKKLDEGLRLQLLGEKPLI